mgnify:CR=1 FL=1
MQNLARRQSFLRVLCDAAGDAVVIADLCALSNFVASVSVSWQTAARSPAFVNPAGNMMTDPISDMLTRIRNALLVRKQEVLIPFSRMKYALAKIIEAEGFVGSVDKTTDQKRSLIRVRLLYHNASPRIQTVRRVSTPGHRVYAKSTEMPRVLSDLGIAVISTSNGLMTNKEARARHLGGEVLCEIY